MRRCLWVALGFCVGLVLVTACGRVGQIESGTSYGPPQKLGNGTVRTYVTADTAGQPSEVGIELTAAALDGLPSHGPSTTVMLDLPEQAGKTDFNHVMVNWNPDGHPPAGVFDKPHFDFHFYMTDMASVMAINPRNPHYAEQAAHLPEPRYVPAGYQPQPGPSAQTAVPVMGLHWLDDPNAFVPNHYNFTHVLINGSWDGQYTFVEPMITRAWLLSKPPMIQDEITQPTNFEHTGYFPTVYRVRYDAVANTYQVSLAGMVMHEAS
jgi:hypothetical protein